MGSLVVAAAAAAAAKSLQSRPTLCDPRWDSPGKDAGVGATGACGLNCPVACDILVP